MFKLSLTHCIYHESVYKYRNHEINKHIILSFRDFDSRTNWYTFNYNERDIKHMGCGGITSSVIIKKNNKKSSGVFYLNTKLAFKYKIQQ